MQMIKRARVMLTIVVLSSAYSVSVASTGDAAFLDANSLIAGWKAHYGGIDRMHFRLSERVIDGGERAESPLLQLTNLIKFHIADMTVDKNAKRFHLQYSRRRGVS